MERLSLAVARSGGDIDGLSGRLVRELVSESFHNDDVAVGATIVVRYWACE